MDWLTANGGTDDGRNGKETLAGVHQLGLKGLLVNDFSSICYYVIHLAPQARTVSIWFDISSTNLS